MLVSGSEFLPDLEISQYGRSPTFPKMERVLYIGPS